MTRWRGRIGEAGAEELLKETDFIGVRFDFVQHTVAPARKTLAKLPAKLAPSRGAGRWQESSGDRSKFGLTATDMLEAIGAAQRANVSLYAIDPRGLTALADVLADDVTAGDFVRQVKQTTDLLRHLARGPPAPIVRPVAIGIAGGETKCAPDDG